VHVREANVDDAPVIAKVHVDSWRTTYAGIVPDHYLATLSYQQRERTWYNILATSGGPEFVYVAADHTGNVIGFASGGPERSGDPIYRGELYAIYLLHRHQRQGIGRQLTITIAKRLVQEGIHSMLVWVLAENPSREFYRSLGGQRLHEKEITIGGARLAEVAYGWPSLRELIHIYEPPARGARSSG
jgi:ribosomal protein S18 acetylase RimI-like enzyme